MLREFDSEDNDDNGGPSTEHCPLIPWSRLSAQHRQVLGTSRPGSQEASNDEQMSCFISWNIDLATVVHAKWCGGSMSEMQRATAMLPRYAGHFTSSLLPS